MVISDSVDNKKKLLNVMYEVENGVKRTESNKKKYDPHYAFSFIQYWV